MRWRIALFVSCSCWTSSIWGVDVFTWEFGVACVCLTVTTNMVIHYHYPASTFPFPLFSRVIGIKTCEGGRGPGGEHPPPRGQELITLLAPYLDARGRVMRDQKVQPPPSPPLPTPRKRAATTQSKATFFPLCVSGGHAKCVIVLLTTCAEITAT